MEFSGKLPRDPLNHAVEIFQYIASLKEWKLEQRSFMETSNIVSNLTNIKQFHTFIRRSIWELIVLS